MNKITTLIILSLLFVSCGTIGEVTERQENGKFESTKDAEILVSIPFDLDQKNQLLVVQDSDYVLGTAKNLNYFEQVITFDELEKEIIRNGKQYDVGS
jgi:hypothetical protein